MIKLTGITWITTYNCNFNCEHCFFDTQAEKKYMDPALVNRVLSDFKYGEKMFWQHLSGGEIFLNEASVFDIIKNIQEHFHQSIGVSTNGFWGTSQEKANDVVKRLEQMGVTGIAVSADTYHQDFMNIEAQKRVVNAIAKYGVEEHSYIMGARVNEDVPNAEAINKQCDLVSEQVKGDHPIPYAIPVVRSLGKGSIINQPKKKEVPQGPCTDLCECLGTRSPFNPAMVWIDPYGNVMICYGLVIGNVYKESFNDIIANYDPDKDEILKVLKEHGPKGIYQLVKDKGLDLPEEYYDECDLCYHSRKALRSLYPDALCPDECYPV